MTLCLCSVVAWTQTFVVDGINYEITSGQTVQVSNYSYSGEIDIPASVQYEENTYIVTRIGANAFSGCVGLTSVTITNINDVIPIYNCC